jgi:ABC-type cobalamin/Fe3+-siderophores transport system ATPase subunit
MNEQATSVLDLRCVRFGFPNHDTFLGPIDVSLRSGEMLAIVGPNGAGKSTLLRLMAGLLRPVDGRITLNGASLASLPTLLRARQIAVLLQHPPRDVLVRALDLVLMGRFPHRSFGLFDSPEDIAIAGEAMAMTETTELADRWVSTLSGGEAQRVHLAAAIAQRPCMLLLDEPTESLDLRHQLQVLHLLRRCAEIDGLAVAFVTHDLNLAGRFGSSVLLMDQGRAVAAGAPPNVLAPKVLEPVYGVALTTLAAEADPGAKWLVPRGFLGGQTR